MSVTASQWAEKVLTTLKLPATTNNINAMLAWMKFEGGHPFNPGSPYTFNPLNTTQKMTGSSSPGGVAGVQAYPDFKTGIDATVKTLSYGFYTAIRNALASNAPPEVTIQAIKTSPWGTTAINPSSWPTLAAQIRAAPPASGSLGFSWKTAGILGALAFAGAAIASVFRR